MDQLECRPTKNTPLNPLSRGDLEETPKSPKGTLRSKEYDVWLCVGWGQLIGGLISILLLFACGSPNVSKTTHIRDTTYKIVPPAIIDSGVMEMRIRNTPLPPLERGIWDSVFIPAPRDTVYQYARISGGDTTVRITFVPRTRWVYYKVKPDTIFYTARDTLTKYETKEVIIETPWMAKVGIYSYGVITVLIIGLIIYVVNWYKYGRAKPIMNDELRKNTPLNPLSRGELEETPKSPKGTLRKAEGDDGLP